MTETLKNSLYLKVRERSCCARFGELLSGIAMNGDRILAANVGLGGLAPIPWHSREAEQALVGEVASDETFVRAAEVAIADAIPPSGLEFKVRRRLWNGQARHFHVTSYVSRRYRQSGVRWLSQEHRCGHSWLEEPIASDQRWIFISFRHQENGRQEARSITQSSQAVQLH